MPNASHDESQFEEAPFVRKVVDDPRAMPETLVLAGFLGKGADPGRWRLYLTRQLDEFVEFDEPDVLHTERIGQGDEDADKTWVWIKPEALGRAERTGASRQAAFLQGDIAASFADATARVRRLHAGGPLLVGRGGGRYADPTLFRGNTCALSACVSDIAICTNPGQTTCDPAVCFAAPKLYEN